MATESEKTMVEEDSPTRRQIPNNQTIMSLLQFNNLRRKFYVFGPKEVI